MNSGCFIIDIFENIGWFGFSLKMGMMVLFNLFDLDLLKFEGCWVCAILVHNLLVNGHGDLDVIKLY